MTAKAENLDDEIDFRAMAENTLVTELEFWDSRGGYSPALEQKLKTQTGRLASKFADVYAMGQENAAGSRPKLAHPLPAEPPQTAPQAKPASSFDMAEATAIYLQIEIIRKVVDSKVPDELLRTVLKSVLLDEELRAEVSSKDGG